MLIKDIKNKTVLTSSDAYNIFKSILLSEDEIGRGQEHLWCISLNARSQINSVELIALGGVDAVNTCTKEIFRRSIVNNAVAILIAHNHPSQNPEPSQEDIAFTKNLEKAAEILGIRFLDHLVICEDSYTSLREKGLI